MLSYKKQIIFLVISAVICLALFFSIYSEVKKQTIRELNNRQMVYAGLAANGIETSFNQHFKILNYLAHENGIIQLNTHGMALIQSFQKISSDEILGMTRIDARGRIIYSYPDTPNVIGTDLSGQEHVRKILRTKKPVVSDVFTAVQGIKAIAIHVPVYRGGTFDGTLGFLISFDSLAMKYLKGINVENAGYAWMISAKGIEIYCPIPGHTGNSVMDNCKDFPDIIAMAKKMMKGEKGVTTYTFDKPGSGVMAKLQKHAVYMPIKTGGTFWSIVVATPEDTVQAPMQSFRNHFIIIMLILLAIFAAIVYTIARGQSAAIEQQKRRQIEDDLVASAVEINDLYHNAPCGYHSIDSNGNVVRINDTELAWLSYTREELIGKPYKNLLADASRDQFSTAFVRLKEQGLVRDVEYDMIRKDGSTFPVLVTASAIRDALGNFVMSRSMVVDMTLHREQEERLRESEKRYRSIIESIEDDYFESDLDGNITFFNKPVSCVGVRREEFLGKKYTNFMKPEMAEKIYETCMQVYFSGTPAQMVTCEFIRTDGGISHQEMSIALMRNAAGEPVGFRGISRNVSERFKMEEERNKLTEQLYQAQKMESIGTLAGGIAHDFNNLLMGIQGYTSLMLLDVDATHPYNEQLKSIQFLVQSGAGLTRQLLGFARAGRYEVATTDLNDLINKSINLFGRTRKEIKIFEKCSESLRMVEVDRGQIEQVLLNIFVNAWQAMPGGGSIYLETANVVFDKATVDQHGLKSGHYIKVSITDTGVGMDEKTRQRIFDPFFTTKEMGQGTGLGLASAYGIIKGHGGIITVYSEKGHGATFNIYLPVSSKQIASDAQLESELIGGRETILLVDDEEVITEVTDRLLNELGYTIITAGSGEEAVKIYEEKHADIDLVIIDMIMPGMSGSETFDRIKAINPSVRAMLSSGYSLNGKAKVIMDKGLRVFLQKPYRLNDLAKKIREALSD